MTPSPAVRRRPRPFPLLTLTLAGSLALAGCEAPSDRPDPSGTRTAAAGTALQAVETLTVKGRAPRTGYERDEFGSAWADTDRNGCGTRVISVLRAVMELFSQRTWGVVGCA